MKIARHILCWSFVILFLSSLGAFASDGSFTNSLAQADSAVKRSDLQEASRIYDIAQNTCASNAVDLCILSHRYCDLTYLTNSVAVQKDLLARATACAQQAVEDDPTNATAHASLAVCYAKSCNFADIKTELAYSRLFKEEAEKAIALDPKQDVPYYLLGRWNYGIASLGLLSRGYVKVVYGGLPKASYQDAIQNFQKAVELSPDHILNHAGLAMAYEAVGDKKSQIIELEMCLSLKPLGPEDIEARREAEKKLAAMRQ